MRNVFIKRTGRCRPPTAINNDIDRGHILFDMCKSIIDSNN